MGNPATRHTDPDCLFCTIIAGDIPSTVVHEDEATFAFRDLEPQAPTHVLVIPRSHYANAADLAAGRGQSPAKGVAGVGVGIDDVLRAV